MSFSGEYIHIFFLSPKISQVRFCSMIFKIKKLANEIKMFKRIAV